MNKLVFPHTYVKRFITYVTEPVCDQARKTTFRLVGRWMERARKGD